MIKKLLTVVLLVLAINFLLVAGGIGYLVGTGKLTKITFGRIQEVLAGAEIAPPAAATQPSATQPASTQPVDTLAEVLARQAGRPTAEQLDLIQSTMDSQTAILDRRQREIEDLKRQVDTATAAVTREREQLAQQRKAFDAQTQEAAKLLTDQGFQDALLLYQTLPPKQVKQIFGGLDDATVQRFLQAMPPGKAAKIIKEFKLPEENSRMGIIIERMRQGKTAEAGGTTGPASKGRAG
jgi:hypothetical protein